MTQEEFKGTLESRIMKIRDTLAAKGAEYATEADRFHNFERAGAMLNCTRERALIGMWVKHVISILDIVDNLETDFDKYSAMADEKIGDAINYLILLEASIVDRKAKYRKRQPVMMPVDLRRLEKELRNSIGMVPMPLPGDK